MYWNLAAHLVRHFKHTFEYFKHTYIHFYTLFHPHVYQKYSNNITQNSFTKHPLDIPSPKLLVSHIIRRSWRKKHKSSVQLQVQGCARVTCRLDKSFHLLAVSVDKCYQRNILHNIYHNLMSGK